MGVPDRIERTVELRHPPQRVWDAVTTADGLASWFGDRVEIDLRPGGEATMTWDESGDVASMRVERVEEPAVFGFTWHVHGLPQEDPRRTYVELVLEPTPDGTRLTVTETGFAQLAPEQHDSAFGGNTRGWQHELGELVAHLDAA